MESFFIENLFLKETKEETFITIKEINLIKIQKIIKLNISF